MNLIPVYDSHLVAKQAMDAELTEIPEPIYINVRCIISMRCDEKYRKYVITNAAGLHYYTIPQVWEKLKEIATEWISANEYL